MRLIDVDAFRREFGFAEECRDCKREAKWECNSQMYSAQDICGWLDDTPTVCDWISVKERMPMLIETVLFIGKNCHGGWFSAKRGYFDGTFWHSEDSGTVYPTTPVTHWMPLPEPPEED